MDEISFQRVSLESSEDTINQLQHFVETTFVDTFGHNYPPQDLEDYRVERLSLSAVKKELAEPGTFFYLVNMGTNGEHLPTGYIKFIVPSTKHLKQPVRYQKPFYLERFYFLEQFQGLGIAQVALQFVISAAKYTHQCDFLYLTVWEHNHRAQRFYQHFGLRTMHSIHYIVGQTKDHEYVYGMHL